MNRAGHKVLIAALGVTLCGFTAAREITRDQGLELMDECQRQREEHIAPLREQAIEECITERRRDRAYCQRYYRDYGEAMPNVGGGMRPGMFWDLPVCEDAYAAERYFKMNPGRRTFELPGS
jgi:hypothetical protein